VVSITSVEPTHADRIPACPARRDGKLVKKSHSRRGTPLIAMSANSATKVSTPIIRATTPMQAKNRSQRLWLAMSFRISSRFFA